MKEFKVIYTTDVHGYFFQTDYISNNKNIGLISLLKDIKKDENTLLIDCGDILQGSPFIQYLEKKKGNFKIASDIMNELKYDYVTLGNHDFNFGITKLKSYVDNLKANVVCCNVDANDLNNLVKSSIKILPNGLKIGIVGAVTDYVNVWDSLETLEGIKISSAYEALKKEVSLLKSQVDFIICIYHGGFEGNVSKKEFAENIGDIICEELEIDLLLTGHQHLNFSNKVLNKTHVIQSSFNAVMYGEITVSLTNNEFTINSKNISHSGVANLEFENKYLDEIKLSNEWLNKEIGILKEEILETDPLNLMKNGWRYADLCNSLILNLTKADISCVSLTNNPYPLNHNVSIKDIFSVCPFSNTLSVIEIDKKILIDALEVVASYFTIVDEELKINEKYTKNKLELYNFDFYYGIDYVFDISKTIGNRVVSIKINGEELDEKKTYKLAVTSYRKTGTGGYDMFKTCKTIENYNEEVKELLIEHFRKEKEVVLPKKCSYKVLI